MVSLAEHLYIEIHAKNVSVRIVAQVTKKPLVFIVALFLRIFLFPKNLSGWIMPPK